MACKTTIDSVYRILHHGLRKVLCICTLKPVITSLLCCVMAYSYRDLCFCLHAQTYTASPDLGNIKGEVQSKFQKPFRINGGIAINSVLTENWGEGATNSNPFSWIATGNINLTLFGTSIPFSFNYSNRKVQYSNPSFKFNRFALHPKYKEWTLHAGDLSTTFSPYTLSGYLYTGAGVEIQQR